MKERLALASIWGAVALAFCLAAAGCGDDGPQTTLPYPIDTTVIIHPDGTVEETRTPDGDGCIDLGGECASPQTVCGSNDARADVVVDADGNVIEVVCYPIEDDGSIVQVDEQMVLAAEPGDVVVIDDRDDGPDVTGNVNLAGDNTVVYGESAATAVIDGDVELSGSSTIARGVRITGDLLLTGGNVSAIFVEVEGNVVVNGNGALLVNSIVYGNVEYSGSNFELVGNALQGGLSASAPLALCEDNVEFADDGDFVLDRDTEVTGPFACP